MCRTPSYSKSPFWDDLSRDQYLDFRNYSSAVDIDVLHTLGPCESQKQSFFQCENEQGPKLIKVESTKKEKP